MSLFRKGTIVVLGAVGLVALTMTAGATPRDDLKAARAATAKYNAVAKARMDGYVPASPCASSPDGTMGIHYVNPRLASDGALDPERPEALLYVPDEDGKLELVGVEYFLVAADQEPPIADDDAPRLFGRRFDGPMQGHSPDMPYHYDLHVWLWADNPSGTFAPWNPALTCGGAS